MDLVAAYNIASHKCIKLIVVFTHHGYETHKYLLRQATNKIFLK